MPTILVIEDDEVNREVIAKFLRREGFRVAVAADGLKGVAMARELLPGLILMDLNLPVLDGWGAMQQIRADPRTAHIPMIALTAHANPDDVVKAHQAGCDAYETKPFLFNRLRSKIESLVIA